MSLAQDENTAYAENPVVFKEAILEAINSSTTKVSALSGSIQEGDCFSRLGNSLEVPFGCARLGFQNARLTVVKRGHFQHL